MMGLIDKLKFWGKDEDEDFGDFSDFGEFGKDSALPPLGKQDETAGLGGTNSLGPMGSSPGAEAPSTLPPLSTPETFSSPSQSQSISQSIPQSFQQRQQMTQQSQEQIQPGQSSLGMDRFRSAPLQAAAPPVPEMGAGIAKDLEIISAKLDTIRATLESVNHRLEALERIAKGEPERPQYNRW
jgi:hypothetical protein